MISILFIQEFVRPITKNKCKKILTNLFAITKLFVKINRNATMADKWIKFALVSIVMIELLFVMIKIVPVIHHTSFVFK